MNEAKYFGCGVFSILLSLPIQFLLSLLYRYPAPFLGYIGPFSNHSNSDKTFTDILSGAIETWLFYGLLGGFFVTFFLAFCVKKFLETKKNNYSLFQAALLAAFIFCFTMANLDFIIGSW
ncbi:hypothetical protein [Litorilituus sediminis]|uniref:Uncharacterized protein n=1 Tax=Litorilituus sediminis TaxID=718192 RepID=A0A4P6P548_9GAMM|nr:hypothetical protein [Litorilituus sediminis]QBG34547.1 hypothetical protein EMK97_01715 [Litorilituus sediminis]